MPFPADFTDQQQYRMESADRALQQAIRTIFRGLQEVKQARASFIAQGLTDLWPATLAEHVHRDRDASTRQEQLDISNFTLHALQQLLNEGAGGGLTPAQASAIFLRYAK